MNTDQIMGLALSGGGVRGFMHIGLLQALEEIGWKPQAISGASIGAIIGAFSAAGHSSEEIMKELGGEGWKRLLKPAFHARGLLSMQGIGSRLEKSLPATFEELAIPLRVNATDLSSGTMHVFDKGPLIPALLASSCLPVIFQTIEIDGKLLADGGMVCNFPVRLLPESCAVKIGSSCNPAGTRPVEGMAQVMERSLNIAIYQNTLPDRQMCHYLVEPQALNGYGIFNLDQRQLIKELGYAEALRVLRVEEGA